MIADDHPAMLDAVAEILERNGFEVVGRAADGEQALALIEATKPERRALDYPDAAAVRHRGRGQRGRPVAPDTAIVFYTAYGDRALLSEALDAGARGFVLKEAPAGRSRPRGRARRRRRGLRRPGAGRRSRQRPPRTNGSRR